MEPLLQFHNDEERLSFLREKAEALPLKPGVYMMMNRVGKIIYVGKSRALKNRVSQYFHGWHDIKTTHMASQVHDFQFIVCDTEMEALALENRLIKQHTPRYNIRLKDAKSYPYLRINRKVPYPRLSMTRNRVDDGSLYFGPYSGVSSVFSIMNVMEKTFGLPSCHREFPRDIGKERPCIYYQTGRCMGVCTGGVSEKEYDEAVNRIVSILKGDTAEAIREASEKMEAAAEDLRFEEAARIRDSIAAMKKLGEKQKAVGSPSFACDLFALYESDTGASMSAFFIRNGYITDTQHFLFGKEEILSEISGLDADNVSAESSPLSSFLYSLYENRVNVPREILLSFPLNERDMTELGDSLSQRTGHKVLVRTPERGSSFQLCQMAVDDARKHLENEQARMKNDERVLISLATALELETVPERIECYDISSYGNEQITAGMIVAKEAKLSKKDYRLFKIKGQTFQDDYGAMREAILRRVEHLTDESGSYSEYPDLILLDGGRGHVHVIREALEEKGIHIPVFGMVKDEHHKTRTLCSDTQEIRVARDMTLFRFLYGLQEEVHRFTVGSMDQAKRKTLKTSSLEKIPGIGPQKAKKLLSHFGTIGKIKEADAEALCQVPGISMAHANEIIAYFEKEKSKEKTI